MPATPTARRTSKPAAAKAPSRNESKLKTALEKCAGLQSEFADVLSKDGMTDAARIKRITAINGRLGKMTAAYKPQG